MEVMQESSMVIMKMAAFKMYFLKIPEKMHKPVIFGPIHYMYLIQIGLGFGLTITVHYKRTEVILTNA